MGCKCNWVESILAIIIIVFALVETAASMWIVVIAAVLLLIHALTCKKCKMCSEDMPTAKKSTKRKR